MITALIAASLLAQTDAGLAPPTVSRTSPPSTPQQTTTSTLELSTPWPVAPPCARFTTLHVTALFPDETSARWIGPGEATTHRPLRPTEGAVAARLRIENAELRQEEGQFILTNQALRLITPP